MEVKELQKVFGQLRQIQENLEKQFGSIAVEASSGNGIVTVKMDARKQVIDLRIAPQAFEGTQETLQELLRVAVNEASRLVDERIAQLSAAQGFPAG